jgi:hypothetical protein
VTDINFIAEEEPETIRLALKIIHAITQEPTEGMIKQGVANLWVPYERDGECQSDLKDAWKAMIKQLIKEVK